jgi:hypothetical protein
MAIEFLCPECSASIRVPDAASGKKGTCPGCGIKLLVPVVEIPPEAAAPATAPIQPQGNPLGAAQPPAASSHPQFPPPQLPPQPSLVSPQSVPQPVFPTAPAGPQFESSVTGPSLGQPDVAAAAFPQQPVTPIASAVRRRSRRKSSALWFPILCGIGLVAGVGWLWMPRANISGDRSAEVVALPDGLPPKQVAASLADVKTSVRKRVLGRFAEDSEWLRSSHAEVEFSAGNDGLVLRVVEGRQTQFVRFRIDQGLREWYDANGQQLDDDHKRELSKALTEFLEAWDVAIRNETGVEQVMRFRDSVGLSGCVYGLGYNVSARVNGKLHPCVYEDEHSLYFLLPREAKEFQVVGFHSNGDPSDFPGEYRVTVKASSKTVE